MVLAYKTCIEYDIYVDIIMKLESGTMHSKLQWEKKVNGVILKKEGNSSCFDCVFYPLLDSHIAYCIQINEWRLFVRLFLRPLKKAVILIVMTNCENCEACNKMFTTP